MAANQPVGVLLPVGRMVQGDMYTPNTTDDKGQPLVYKTGANAGQPRSEYYIAVAVPKTPGCAHWANEVDNQNPKVGAWGLKIWQFGHTAWPQGQGNAPTFAWKIEDGDSAIPNKAGKKNCDREGYPGHWIVKMGGSFAPKIVTADGSEVISAVGAVKRGYYLQAFFTISSNESQQSPGLYLNHQAFALAGYGPELTSGPDISSMGFGGAALPAGASTVPVGVMTPPAIPGAAAGVPGVPVPGAAVGAPGVPVPGAAAGVPGVPVPGAAVGAPGVPVPGMPIIPNPAFAAGAAGLPPAPGIAPPPVAPQHVMTASAGGQPYEAWITAGWNDAQLRQAGHML